MQLAQEDQVITVAQEDGVATITLNRPDKMNAFTYQMRDALLEALDQADADDAVRAIILTGAGKAFCAGADLSLGAETFEIARHAQAEGALDASDPKLRDAGGEVNLRIWAAKKPVIAAINGAAVGVGATMILPADFRLASETARFGYVFARRGIVWDGVASWFLPRIVGVNQALEWGLTGRVFTAREAETGGLVRSVHAPEDLLPAARSLAREIVENCAPVSVSLMRQMAWRMLTEPNPMVAHRLESQGIVHAGLGPDAREGVTAFLEKRKPDFALRPSADMPPYHPWWEDEDY